MHIGHIRPALRQRLGDPAAAELLDLFDHSRDEGMEQVTGAVSDRLERRLAEEIPKLRMEMTHGFAALRQEMTNGSAALRQEMSDGFASLRKEIADQRFDILRWVFLFWVGQFFAVASLMVVMVRYLQP